MAARLLTVTAHTTRDVVEAVATGESFEWESVAVVNATTGGDGADRVRDDATETE
ncbi:DUF6360 family protein [Halopiger djelfimassiliensis]|uniref:DUF6360 family protein n=1 Tax=Halopiger djelfimassiliensis TaxID=1293047 RepID=UPI000AC061BA